MAKGHWYTDKQGQHYFVEDGQSPKEGWEASKRRKMIDGGKFRVSEDGSEYRDVNRDEYDKFEADESDFDLNNDDDFGFDEDEYPEDEFSKSQKMSKEEFVDDLVNNKGWDKEEAKRHADLQFGDDDEESSDIVANRLIANPAEVTTEHYVNELKELRNTKGYDEQELIDKIAKNIDNGYGNEDSLQFAIDDYTKELYDGDDIEIDADKAMEARKQEERAKLDKEFPRKGDEKLEKEVDDILNSDEEQLKSAIQNADDSVLDEQFGKNGPERKLAGAIKEGGKPKHHWEGDDGGNGKHLVIDEGPNAGSYDSWEDYYNSTKESRQPDIDTYKKFIDKYHNGDINQFVEYSKERANYWRKHGEEDFAKRFEEDAEKVSKLLKGK